MRERRTVRFEYADGQELVFYKNELGGVTCVKHNPESDLIFVEDDMVTQLTWNNFSDAIYDVLHYLKGKQS
jgi:hypothetical protein